MLSLYTPAKIIRDPHDSFFEEGTIAIRAYWLERDARSERDITIIREEASMLTDDLTRPIFCEHVLCVSAHGGPIAFPSITAYEEHYEARHCHVCIECNKTFPNATFLRLHLDEYHDAFLRIRKERGEKIYQCFVENCDKKCMTTARRTQHLVHKHRYPADFPFDIVMTGTLSFEERQIRKRRREKRARQRPQQPTTPRPGACSPSSTPVTTHEKHTRGSPEDQQVDGPAAGDGDDDMELDQLTGAMATLSIPKTISFGRSKPSFPPRREQQNNRRRQNVNEKQEINAMGEDFNVHKPKPRGKQRKKHAMDIIQDGRSDGATAQSGISDYNAESRTMETDGIVQDASQ